MWWGIIPLKIGWEQNVWYLKINLRKYVAVLERKLPKTKTQTQTSEGQKVRIISGKTYIIGKI